MLNLKKKPSFFPPFVTVFLLKLMHELGQSWSEILHFLRWPRGQFIAQKYFLIDWAQGRVHKNIYTCI